MHRGVDIRRVIWILLVVLTVLTGVTAVGIAANSRRKALGGGTAGPKQLAAGPGGKASAHALPVFRNLNDRDMRAIYEYLRAIPSSL